MFNSSHDSKLSACQLKRQKSFINGTEINKGAMLAMLASLIETSEPVSSYHHQ